MSETGRATPQDFVLESIVLERLDGDLITIYPPPKDDGATQEIFQGMNITEGIFEPTTKGSITIRDAFDAFEGFNPVGGETLKIKAYTPDIDRELPSENHAIDCVFIVHDFTKISNEAGEQISGPSTGQVFWKLDFCTPEYFLYKQEEGYLEDDFIGPISGEDGLVQQLREKYFNNEDGKNRQMLEDNVEDTANSIWLKKNNLMYPWGKNRSNPNLFGLMDSLAENSISSNNPNAVNYLFYNTTKGYSFRSVNDMITKAEEEPKEYRVNVQKPDDDDSVEHAISISEFDHLSLWKNGGYSSYYTLTRPSYEDPYFDHLDFNASHDRVIVDYQYHRDFDNIEHIEEYKLLPDDVVTEKGNATQIHDNIYGYFGEYHNNANRHTDVTNLNYEDGYGNLNGKSDKKTWQTMFDITSLPVSELKTIQDIKEELVENKQQYARLRNLRNKFDTYECSVCCLQSPPGVTGSIDEYKIVSAGSFSDVVDYEQKENEEGIRFRTSYGFGEGATGPWNETLGEFYYLKNEVPDYQEYVLNTEIVRLEIALKANQEYLTACENEIGGIPNEDGCPDCDYVRSIRCGACVSDDNSCADVKQETLARIDRITKRLNEWYEYREEFPESYNRNWNKKAYFISKQPENDKLNSTIVPDSLFNVKSIKRIPLRNSRYEQFARKYNVKDGELGEWIYNAYLGNNQDIDPTQPGGHPIYDQKYMPFDMAGPSAYRDASQRWWGLTRSDYQNQFCDTDVQPADPPNPTVITYNTCESCFTSEAGFYGGVNVDLTEVDTFTWRVGTDYDPGPCGELNAAGGRSYDSEPVYETTEHGPPWGIVAPPWHPNRGEILLPGGEFDPFVYSQRWNFYLDDIADYTPVTIKRKEVQSFVRIEFEQPIGLETLEEFPTGFIRDAGYEYFLPYLVMLTPGPYGKQGTRKNIAVIGIDPYGFDVAVEPDDPDYGENTDDEGMNLYPTEEWETETPYYTTSGGRGYDYYSGGRYGSYGRAYSNRSWNRKGHAYDTLYHSSVNVSSGAPNSYYHFDYTPPLPAYHKYDGWYYGNYGYGNGYDYIYNWHSNYNGYYYNYFSNYYYDVWDYEEPSLSDTDSFGSGTWWSWRWFYGYSWVWGTEAEYRPGTPEEEIWKYDSSGNTEYGMIEPPQGHAFYYQRSSEKNEFGRNFAAQFVVFSRRNVNSCSQDGYRCANPEGPVSSFGCSEDDPYCNCPAKYLIPRNERVVSREELIQSGVDVPSTNFLNPLEYLYFIVDQENNIIESFEGPPGATIDQVINGTGATNIQDWLQENGTIPRKPTDEDLEEAKRLTKECELISENLDSSWLGCLWSNLDDPISCACPGRGDNFKKYIEYTRSQSTFWNTPENTPLLRNAQMLQLNSQKALIVVNGDFSVQPGDIISLKIPLGVDTDRENTRASGKWLVSQINHAFATQQTHRMVLSLVRDTSSVPVDKASWVNWFSPILGS